MAQESGFLSRLRKGKHPKDEEEEAVVQEAAEAPAEAPAEEEKPAAMLDIPVSHALNVLWAAYAGAAADPPPQPLVDLTEATAPIDPGIEGAGKVYLLAPGQVEAELAKVERVLTAAAARRFAKLKKTEPGSVGPPDLDAEVVSYIGTGGLTAWFMVLPPSGEGEHLDRNMIRVAVDDAKLVNGVDDELLRALPDRPDRYFQFFLAARGEPPVNGKDGYVVERFSRNPTRALAEDDTGRVDFTAADLFQTVEKGSEICEIHNPTPPRNGMDVLGKSVAAKPGKPPVIPKGRNTELTEDGMLLIASCSGHVEFSGRTFQVRPVLEIHGNVDYSTGSIKSLGDIHISGDVLSGFTVTSAGNITIDGVVEACEIEAGGDLVIRSGVQGNGTANLQAHGSIFARFLESANVYVGQDLDAECLVNCNVYCDGSVKVRSGRGSIVGGMTHAAREVSSNIIGARSEALTTVILGGTPCADYARTNILLEIEDLQKELERLERQPDSPTRNRLIAKTRVHIMTNNRKLEAFDEERASEEPAEGPSKQAGRLVASMLFPGVEVTIGRMTQRVTHQYGMCTVSLVKGEIAIV